MRHRRFVRTEWLSRPSGSLLMASSAFVILSGFFFSQPKWTRGQFILLLDLWPFGRYKKYATVRLLVSDAVRSAYQFAA